MEPVAVVVVVAVCVAWAESLPPSPRSWVPVPIEAVVVTLEIPIATCAETAALPLPAEAPPKAVVVIASVPVAFSVRSPTPVSQASFGRPAVVVSLTTFSASDAPTPVVSPAADCLASARA